LFPLPDDDRTPAVRVAQEPQRGVGDLAAGGFHQGVGDPTLLRRAIQPAASAV
jgi:hypothetical protein